MSTERICSSCGKALPATAPQGLCPECLMRAGFGTGVAPEGGEPTQTVKFVPPPVEGLAGLLPQYEILELLGQGGMGAVYKARQRGLDRVVALKILPPQLAGGPGFAERFTREARALARLSHPNVVGVYDFGQAGEFHYLVMEFVDGANLRQVERAGKLSPREALKLIPQVCEALQFAHDEGIVHRDIKPENILVDKRGRVKIADFGIAKLLGKAGDATLTGAKDVVGTPHYMAPEQVERPQTVDHRADIYSLGVVFYEMLTGELPLGKFQPPSRKVEMDVRLDEVVLHALEKEPERRYQQASQVKTDVQMIASTPSSAAPQASAAREAARRQITAPAIGLLVTGILNWILLPVAAVVIFWVAPVEWKGGALDLSSTAVKTVCVGSLALCSFVIFAALKMMRLEAYWTAVTAAILAILVAPANLVGLPIGIWSLAALMRADVKAAFVPSRGERWVTVATFLALGILGALLIQIGGHLIHKPETKVSRSDSTAAAALAAEGWRLWQGGRPAEAIEKFERAVSLDATNTGAWNGLGWASFNSGKPAEAEKAFQRVIALEAGHPAALNGLGQVYLAQKKFADAESYLLKASPKAPAAWHGLARLYLLQGNFEQAERWAKNLVDSGQADDLARRMLEAARDKKVSEGLRMMIEPQ